MNNKFDELAKGLAQSTTRRQALKRFGVGLAGMALACFGLANTTRAGACDAPCDTNVNVCCCGVKGDPCKTGLPACNPNHASCKSLCAQSDACHCTGKTGC
jgi:hypothetical protein